MVIQVEDSVDLIGRGNSTWCAGDSGDNTYADGVKWGTFGGNSSSIPSTEPACIAEKFYIKNKLSQLINLKMLQFQSQDHQWFFKRPLIGQMYLRVRYRYNGSRSSTTNNLEIVIGRLHSYIYDQGEPKSTNIYKC